MTVGGCAGVPALHRSCQALSARLSASKAFPPGTVCVQDVTQTSAAWASSSVCSQCFILHSYSHALLACISSPLADVLLGTICKRKGLQSSVLLGADCNWACKATDSSSCMPANSSKHSNAFIKRELGNQTAFCRVDLQKRLQRHICHVCLQAYCMRELCRSPSQPSSSLQLPCIQLLQLYSPGSPPQRRAAGATSRTASTCEAAASGQDWQGGQQSGHDVPTTSAHTVHAQKKALHTLSANKCMSSNGHHLFFILVHGKPAFCSAVVTSYQ